MVAKIDNDHKLPQTTSKWPQLILGSIITVSDKLIKNWKNNK